MVRHIKTGKNILQATKSLMKAGVIEKPVWYDAMVRCPPRKPVLLRKGQIPEITFPEDELRKTYIKRNPDSQQEKINLINSMTTGQKDMRPASFRFVDKQLYYMQEKGMSEEQAYDTVKAIMAKEAQALAVEQDSASQAAQQMGTKPTSDFISIWQDHELAALREGMTEANKAGMPLPSNWDEEKQDFHTNPYEDHPDFHDFEDLKPQLVDIAKDERERLDYYEWRKAFQEKMQALTGEEDTEGLPREPHIESLETQEDSLDMEDQGPESFTQSRSPQQSWGRRR